MKTGQGSKIAGGNPTRGRVDNDYYATHPDSIKALLEERKRKTNLKGDK